MFFIIMCVEIPGESWLPSQLPDFIKAAQNIEQNLIHWVVFFRNEKQEPQAIESTNEKELFKKITPIEFLREIQETMLLV